LPKNENSVIIYSPLCVEHKRRYLEEYLNMGRISMGPINELVINILQSILFCGQQKTEIHTGSEQLEGE